MIKSTQLICAAALTAIFSLNLCDSLPQSKHGCKLQAATLQVPIVPRVLPSQTRQKQQIIEENDVLTSEKPTEKSKIKHIEKSQEPHQEPKLKSKLTETKPEEKAIVEDSKEAETAPPLEIVKETEPEKALLPNEHTEPETKKATMPEDFDQAEPKQEVLTKEASTEVQKSPQKHTEQSESHTHKQEHVIIEQDISSATPDESLALKQEPQLNKLKQKKEIEKHESKKSDSVLNDETDSVATKELATKKEVSDCTKEEKYEQAADIEYVPAPPATEQAYHSSEVPPEWDWFSDPLRAEMKNGRVHITAKGSICNSNIVTLPRARDVAEIVSRVHEKKDDKYENAVQEEQITAICDVFEKDKGVKHVKEVGIRKDIIATSKKILTEIDDRVALSTVPFEKAFNRIRSLAHRRRAEASRLGIILPGDGGSMLKASKALYRIKSMLTKCCCHSADKQTKGLIKGIEKEHQKAFIEPVTVTMIASIKDVSKTSDYLTTSKDFLCINSVFCQVLLFTAQQESTIKTAQQHQLAPSSIQAKNSFGQLLVSCRLPTFNKEKHLADGMCFSVS